MLPEHDRRTFLTVLGSAAALTVTATAESTEAPSQPAPAGGVDITWFDAFKGKHKQVFDLGTYLSAHREINRLEPPNDINVIMGISHKAFPMNATDALWEKYALGEVWGIKDKATGKASVRNIFVDGPVAGPATVRALKERGIVFWQCNAALGAIAAELAAKTGGKAIDIRADLTAGLLPDVRLVPAHTWAIGFVQERGFTYEKL
jgi:hypothetical protein